MQAGAGTWREDTQKRTNALLRTCDQDQRKPHVGRWRSARRDTRERTSRSSGGATKAGIFLQSTALELISSFHVRRSEIDSIRRPHARRDFGVRHGNSSSTPWNPKDEPRTRTRAKTWCLVRPPPMRRRDPEGYSKPPHYL